MPDWLALARLRLAPLKLDSAREDEIIAELAGHMEDLHADLVRQGTPEAEAVRSALSAGADWGALRREIQLSANEELIMNYRIKALWLPGLCSGVLSMLLLRWFQAVSPEPAVFWLWHGVHLVIYWGWLACLPVVGAAGAFWSRRGGGRLLEQGLAASLHILALMCVMTLIFCIRLVVDFRTTLGVPAVGFAVYLLGWGIAPCLLLLLGALPFFRRDASAKPGQAVVSH